MDISLAKKVFDSQTTNDAVDRLSLEEISKIDIGGLRKLRYLCPTEKVNYRYLPGDRYARHLVDENGVVRYCEDYFTPRKNSIYLKPSFAGRQIVMGVVDGVPVLSNGVWFEHFVEPTEQPESGDNEK